MDVEAHVVVPAQDALARVESHAHADGPHPGGPGLGREGALCGGRRRHCRYGALEDDEECVSLGRDLDPPAASIAARKTAWWRSMSGPNAGPRAATRRVDPSMSVNRNVSVPTGREAARDRNSGLATRPAYGEAG